MAAYLITQATSQQSQWVIKNLLEADVAIHTVTSNLDKIPARFDSRNVKLFHGESKNFDDVFKSAKGCTILSLSRDGKQPELRRLLKLARKLVL